MGFLSWLKGIFSGGSAKTIETAKSGPYVDTKNHGRVYFPANGRFVQESHYANNMERFANGLFPSTSTEKIDIHLKNSFELLKKFFPNAVFEKVYSDRYKREWTPANDGGTNEYGQAARGSVRPAPEEELWQGNMFFTKLPAIGTKFMVSANGKKVVIQMGYEIGPGGTTFLGGLTTEVHYALGTDNDSKITIYVCDQNLPLGPVENDSPPPVQQEIPKVDVSWMQIAEKEIGVTEVPGVKHNPRVVEFHQATSLRAKDDEISWCAAFTCWVLQQAGYKSTKSAWARDFEKYGMRVSKPEYGCIMGFERNGPGGDSHVAFYTGREDQNYYYVLGGNQDNQVKVKGYAKKDLIYMRWPVK